MTGSNIYNTATRPIASGQWQEFLVSGEYLRIIGATYGTIDDLEISINNGAFGECFNSFALNLNNALNRDPVYDYEAPQIQEDDFYSVRIKNTNANTNTVTLAYGSAAIIDDRIQLSGNITANSNISANVDTVTDVSVSATSTGQIVAADATRLNVIITNLSPLSVTTPMRIGDSNAGASRGFALYSNQTVQLDTEDAVYAYNADSSARSVAVTVQKSS